MATSPLGGFADVSGYRAALDAAKLQQMQFDPLAQLIQGSQQGLALGQFSPRGIAAQRQAQQDAQLARELNNALAVQRLDDLRNPNQALMRQIQKDLALKTVDPVSGIIASPVGLESEIIATPGALTEEQQTFVEAGGAVPTVQAGAPIVPVTIAGQPTGFAQDIERAIANTEAVTRAKGTSALERQLLTNAQATARADADRASREKIAAEGNVTKKEIADKKATTGGRGMTPNIQSKIITQATLNGVDPDDEKYFDADGQQNFRLLAIDAGKAARENKRIENAIKAQALTGTSKTFVESLNAADKQLDVLKDEVEDLAKSGKEPGFWDSVIAAGTAAPADGYWSGIANQLAKMVQSPESKVLEGKKAIIQSALTKAISGLAVSEGEARRLGFLPRPEDSFNDVLTKIVLVESYIKNQRSGLQMGTSPAAPSGTTVPSGDFKASTGLIIRQVQ